jgi:hypothetical protein
LFVQCEGVYGAVLRINDDIVTKKFMDMALIKKPLKRNTKIKMGKSISKNVGRNRGETAM